MNYTRFADINLDDPFFDSLKRNYAEFTDWFMRKAVSGESAYILTNAKGLIDAFLYLKIETESVSDIEPSLEEGVKIKVGTLKVNAHGTRLGERLVKKIFDYAVVNNADIVYVTVFDEHESLIDLLIRYGFTQYGFKQTINGKEKVLVKSMREIHNDLLLDYPLIQTKEARKFVLSIRPEFHSKLFPDSILNNEAPYDIIRDVSATNSIHKTYLCYMRGVQELKANDVV